MCPLQRRSHRPSGHHPQARKPVSPIGSDRWGIALKCQTLLTPRRCVNSKREGVLIADVEGVDGIGNLPAQPHDGAEGHHVVLHQVIKDIASGGILYHAAVENLEGHILPNGVDQLAPVAHDSYVASSITIALAGAVLIAVSIFM